MPQFQVSCSLETDSPADQQMLEELGISQALLDRVARAVCDGVRALQPDAPEVRGFDISVACISDERMRELNSQYRAKDKTTDVLSFGFFPSMEDAGVQAGELVISLGQVRAQAEEYHHSARFEWLFLFVHGILHLFGYTDDTDETREHMERLGHEFLTQLGLGEDRV